MYLNKYKHLAVQSPLGLLINLKAETDWDSWINLLQKNRIIDQLQRRGYQGTLEDCAVDIYAAAIWGYGVSDWKEGQKDPSDFIVKNFFKGRRYSNDMLLIGPGGTPLCFYLLDVWLESLCQDIIKDHLSLD